MAVFVFGAGATRGANFVPDRSGACLPPLDRDFFTQLQRVQQAKNKQIVTRAIRDVVELFGVNFDLTLERVFTTIEQSLRMVRMAGERRDFKTAEFTKKRANLLQAVACTFEEALVEGHERRPCAYHGVLVSGMKSSDRILTFNYDCLLDDMLKRKGSGIWNPRYGYGFKLGARGASLTGDEYWAPEKPALKNDTLQFLKLHGSLHFDIDTVEKEKYHVKLKERPYTRQHGDLRFSIIAPEWNKAYDQGAFANLWKQAGRALYKAHTLVFIGYSLPPSDLHASSLFRISVKRDSLQSLAIVNPDRSARKRVRDAVQKGITSDTRVFVFDSLEEFSKVDRALWDRG